jgi:hypothetical protein
MEVFELPKFKFDENVFAFTGIDTFGLTGIW